MSWQATSWVKSLKKHADGSPLTARQKLVLFVLADYHNEERGFAWVSTRRAAEETLTSRQWLIAILGTIERHGTIRIERREGKTHLYHFPLVKPVDHHLSSGFTALVKSDLTTTGKVRVDQRNHKESLGNIQPETKPYDKFAFCPADYVLDAIEEAKRTHQSTDAVLAEWRDHPEKRPF